MSGDVISFRKQYWTVHFPIEARVLQWNERLNRCDQLSQLLHVPSELLAFQDELTRRESTSEWHFLAYFEA